MKILDLYVTKICNLNCEYCYVDLVKDEKSFEYNNFIKRIDLLKYDHIKFFWGEPLLKWLDIKKIVNWIRSKNKKIHFTIVTNWLLLDIDKLYYCLNNNIEVVISMHYKWLRKILNKIQFFLFAKNIIWFNFIFEESKINFPYKIINLLQKKGFINFILVPEIYTNWDSKNILKLKDELEKLEKLYISNLNINFQWISWKELKIIKKWCEKTIMWKQWNIFLCNRFKTLDKLKKYNYEYIYNKFNNIINLENDVNRWFYTCPIWWFLDSLNLKDLKLEDRIKQFKSLNYTFINFFKKINKIKWRLNFLSDNINEIRFNLTSQCNIRCKYCYIDFKNKRIDEKVARNIIDYFLLQNWKEKKISFFWWEPLLEFKLLKNLVFYAKEIAIKNNRHIKFTIATNFLLINKEKTQFLKENNFEIHVSFNWKKEINDKLRDNSTELLLSNLNKCSSVIWRKDIVILLAFSNFEVWYLYENLKYIYNLWFRNISLELIFWKKYIWNKNDIFILKKELLKIKKSNFYNNLNVMNLKKENRFLDISIKWEAWENSFKFNNFEANFEIKKIFNVLIRKIFNK